MCGNEIKISQYADDTTMILDDSKKSFTSVLLDLELFCAISGLRLNNKKTESVARVSSKKTGSIAHSASPHGLLTRRPFELRV